MSHWRSGKLKLKCSIGLLKRALIGIVEEWESHLLESEEGKLDLYDYQGNKKTGEYFLVIPGKGDPHHHAAPGFTYSGLGVRKQVDGTWVIDVDEAGLSPEARNITGKINSFVAAEKIKKIASQQGNRIVSDQIEGGKRKIRITMPIAQKYQIHA